MARPRPVPPPVSAARTARRSAAGRPGRCPGPRSATVHGRPWPSVVRERQRDRVPVRRMADRVAEQVDEDLDDRRADRRGAGSRLPSSDADLALVGLRLDQPDRFRGQRGEVDDGAGRRPGLVDHRADDRQQVARGGRDIAGIGGIVAAQRPVGAVDDALGASMIRPSGERKAWSSAWSIVELAAGFVGRLGTRRDRVARPRKPAKLPSVGADRLAAQHEPRLPLPRAARRWPAKAARAPEAVSSGMSPSSPSSRPQQAGQAAGRWPRPRRRRATRRAPPTEVRRSSASVAHLLRAALPINSSSLAATSSRDRRAAASSTSRW